MRREIATSTVISAAVHAALLIGLIGVRFEASEKPAFGTLDVAWVVLDDRIDAGSGPAAPSNAAAVAAAADSAPAEQTASPPAPELAASPPAPELAASPPAPELAASPPAPELTASPPAPEPTASREPPASPPVQPAATPNAGPPVAAPPVAVAAPVPASPTPTASTADFDADASNTPANQSISPPARTAPPSEPPPQSHPLVAEVETLTRDADALSQTNPVAFEHDGEQYTATFRVSPAADDMALDELIVAVSTEKGGDRRTTEMRFKRLAFSHFAQFVDRWDPAVQIHDDEIDGRFHSNSEIYIDTSRGIKPTFHGKVTTSRGISTLAATGRFRRAEVFLGGLETRAGRIMLKRDLDGLPSSGESNERAHRFDEDVRITFYADGSYGWQPVDASAPERRQRVPDATLYVLGDDAEVFVQGTVNGRVLVHSNETIVIEGDLTYASNPSVRADADDYLGLVSEKNVEVAEPDITGPGDLEVHAAIYAKRRFVIQRYRARENATLSILGSVTAGSLTASEPRYRTRVRFDSRLESVRPPGFPMTDRYELAAWDGRWTP